MLLFKIGEIAIKTLVLKTFLIFIMSLNCSMAFEFKSNVYGSLALVGKKDGIFQSFNTLLVGFPNFKFGGFYGHEFFHGDVIDKSFGGAVRIGESTFLETQLGYFERDFRHTQRLRGKGFIANLLLGVHPLKRLGISVILSAKRITSGTLQPRWIIDFLPFLGVRLGF